MNATAVERLEHRIAIDALPDYSERIDVRSPAEYAIDHIPGAQSHPVLDDDERARIGTMHACDSAFAARHAGAAIVARNIAAMLDGPFRDKPRDWAPLVYCWRGGQRSRSLTHMLNEIGWRAVQLAGGYRAYRRNVVALLDALPPAFDYRVVCGLTGSGKSRLIGALAAEGAQVLDLEGIARHRGSLLGDLPVDPQPTQKAFESELVAAMQRFERNRPVYVESESKRIGTLSVPESLLATMREAPCIRVELPRALRIELLKDEYAHFLADPALLADRLARLVPLHGKKVVEAWSDAAKAGDWNHVIAELLDLHYDPAYSRSIGRNFPRIADAVTVAPAAAPEEALRALARELAAEDRLRVTA
ncbi:MAG TPA: tRNA 2-selenouridine(34) synthase MnmH [Casimicrobiaceae bacterium]|nr:tRNA 2-selenouridine(34) synthase MnmH [Casimicrobiaceae bacterium]